MHQKLPTEYRNYPETTPQLPPFLPRHPRKIKATTTVMHDQGTQPASQPQRKRILDVDSYQRKLRKPISLEEQVRNAEAYQAKEVRKIHTVSFRDGPGNVQDSLFIRSSHRSTPSKSPEQAIRRRSTIDLSEEQSST